MFKPRVLLIRSPFNYIGHDRHSVGAISLASAIERQADVELADPNRMRKEDLWRKMGAGNYDVIGISSWQLLEPDKKGLAYQKEIAEKAKTLAPNALLIAGGPDTVHEHENVRETYVPDLILRGEAENTLSQLISRVGPDRGSLRTFVATLRKGRLSQELHQNLGKIAGLVNCHGAPFENEHVVARLTPEELDNLKFNWKWVGEMRPDDVVSFSSSRGCTGSCTYCNHAYGKIWRGMGADKVVSELEKVRELLPAGIVKKIAALSAEKKKIPPGLKRHFSFEDENFAHDRGRVLELSRKVREKGLDSLFSFHITTTADSLLREGKPDEALLDAFRDMGVGRIAVGTESFSDSDLKRMAKGRYTFKQVDALVAALEKRRIVNEHFMILSNPGVTPASFAESLVNAERLAVNNWHFSFRVNSLGLKAYPGAPLWNAYPRKGRVPPEDPTVWKTLKTFEKRYSKWPKIADANNRLLQLRSISNTFYKNAASRLSQVNRKLGLVNADGAGSQEEIAVLEKEGASLEEALGTYGRHNEYMQSLPEKKINGLLIRYGRKWLGRGFAKKDLREFRRSRRDQGKTKKRPMLRLAVNRLMKFAKRRKIG